jgi:hypothetical protein
MQISKIEVHSRTFPRYDASRRLGRQLQKYNQAPRIYVSIEGENILQNLANRTVRPNVLYKKLIKDAVLAALGVSAATHDLVWSQKAGCSMCPCSPGFILKHKPDASYAPTTPSRSFDVWVTVCGDDAAIADGKQPRFIAELV